jgi:hypothetical protein
VWYICWLNSYAFLGSPFNERRSLKGVTVLGAWHSLPPVCQGCVLTHPPCASGLGEGYVHIMLYVCGLHRGQTLGYVRPAQVLVPWLTWAGRHNLGGLSLTGTPQKRLCWLGEGYVHIMLYVCGLHKGQALGRTWAGLGCD